MARLFKQKNSKYWYVDLRTENGKKRFSTGTTIKKEANEIAAYQQEKLYRAKYFDDLPTISIGEAVKLYLKDQKGLSKATYAQSKTLTKIILNYFGENLPFEKLRNADVLKFRNNFEHLKPTTRNHLVRCLTTIKNRCEEWGYQEPKFKIKPLKETQKTRHLMNGEEESLLNAITDQDNLDLVYMLLDTGVRSSDAHNLTWDSVEEDYINFTVNKVNKNLVVYMTQRLKKILCRRRRETNSPFVFPHRDNPNKPRGYAMKSLRNAFDRAGLNTDYKISRYGKFTPHSLRHSFATKLINRGANLTEVQTMLSHSSPQMTQRYAHLDKKAVAIKAAKLLE